MIRRKKNLYRMAVAGIFLCALYVSLVQAQNYQIVWSDEFNGSALDRSVWSFELGQFNDCVHYSTDRTANTQVTDGKLQMIALKESYLGYEYTASVIKTKHALYWRYGRVEALIKLPVSNGFVPAFWLLPEDESYGWWPASGEIDIMEHPTNEITKIYGTIHSGAYNSFTGSGPRGGNIEIADAESAYHLYAVEWTPEKIDFFVDDQKYYTFTNDHNGSQTWPFDKPFYIILNMAVGGGWVGNPTESTVFPAVMEVDYVRVYQDFNDIGLYGPDYIMTDSEALVYAAPDLAEMQYEWTVPNTSQITGGQNTAQIDVDWGYFSGTVEAQIISGDGTRLIKYPVSVSNNLLKNSDFEKGAKYWKKSGYFPADADFTISTQDVHSGDHSVFVNVKSPGTNTWDVQLSQTDLALKSGQMYNVTFWAKSETNSNVIAAIINASNFSLYASNTFQITSTWTQYNLSFKSPATAVASFNFDLGGHTGTYYFDDVQLNIPANQTNNQIKNADFSAGDSLWVLTTLHPAAAEGNVQDGEYRVSIANGGIYAWDVHFGQTGLTVEKDKEYTVSFDAYASEPREIIPLVGKNSDPWTVYSGNQSALLSTRRKTYTYSFIMKEPTDNQARLGFDVGLSAGDVIIDNVVLDKGIQVTDVNEQISRTLSSYELFQNWPNPFNPGTTIKFDLPQAGFVSVKIFDFSGRLIRTLVENELVPGVHQFYWDGSGNASGVYFCKFTASGVNRTIKMILIK